MLMPTRVIFPNLLSIAKRKQQFKEERGRGGDEESQKEKEDEEEEGEKRVVGGMNSYQSENRLCLL